jgi:hypothetical protein
VRDAGLTSTYTFTTCSQGLEEGRMTWRTSLCSAEGRVGVIQKSTTTSLTTGETGSVRG